MLHLMAFLFAAQLTVCICVTPDRARSLLELNPPHLKHIILIQSDDSLGQLRQAAGDGVQIHDFQEILVSWTAPPHPCLALELS